MHTKSVKLRLYSTPEVCMHQCSAGRYFVPEQYVSAITAALTGRSSFGAGGGGSAADMEEQMLQEAIRRSMGQ
jgi:hypothetical protein